MKLMRSFRYDYPTDSSLLVKQIRAEKKTRAREKDELNCEEKTFARHFHLEFNHIQFVMIGARASHMHTQSGRKKEP